MMGPKKSVVWNAVSNIKHFIEVKVAYDRINLKTKSNHLLKKHTEAYRVAPLP